MQDENEWPVRDGGRLPQAVRRRRDKPAFTGISIHREFRKRAKQCFASGIENCVRVRPSQQIADFGRTSVQPVNELSRMVVG
jgi:hypothetical protein